MQAGKLSNRATVWNRDTVMGKTLTTHKTHKNEILL
jgi:hypothetical protein